MKTFLSQAQQHGELRLFDVQFSRHMSELNGADVPELMLAASLVSHGLAQGDTCLALESVAGSSLYSNPALRAVRQKLPTVARWREKLLEQKVVCEAPLPLAKDDEYSEESAAVERDGGSPNQSGRDELTTNSTAPLIIDNNDRLYLCRYWMLEQSLIESVSGLLKRDAPAVDDQMVALALDALFTDPNVADPDPTNSGQPDWQKVAVATAIDSNLCVITGGPGTGKTYTVTALLALLLQQGVAADKIALAAPTGKAAARLTQSISATLAPMLSSLKLPEVVFEAKTLHSLLGMSRYRLQPKHHTGYPLPYDVVIIDEASMIDLPMMVRTLEALSSTTRIVLIGDKDQLHSVESGMVLGDMCGARSTTEFSPMQIERLNRFKVTGLVPVAEHGGDLSDHIVYLHKSRRTRDDGSIGELAGAINAGDADLALQLLQSKELSNIQLVAHDVESINQALRQYVLPVYQQVALAKNPLEALRAIGKLGVLCAVRHGRHGAVQINEKIQRLLSDNQMVDPESHFYNGRPVMITENNYHQNLFNGDHGIIFSDGIKNPMTYFAFDDAELRSVSPARLPEHETFYAMTIHKSQGSEYDTVLTVLPDTDSPILSRELLYTAVTRAKSHVIIVANVPELKACIERRSQRQSGWRDAFWRPLAAAPDSPVKRPVASIKKPKVTISDRPSQTQLDF